MSSASCFRKRASMYTQMRMHAMHRSQAGMFLAPHASQKIVTGSGLLTYVPYKDRVEVPALPDDMAVDQHELAKTGAYILCSKCICVPRLRKA